MARFSFQKTNIKKLELLLTANGIFETAQLKLGSWWRKKSLVAPSKEAPPSWITSCSPRISTQQNDYEWLAPFIPNLMTRASKTIVFCDQTITFAWVQNDARQRKTFMSTRVIEIHMNSHPGNSLHYCNSHKWQYCRSELNVADDLSRGLTSVQLATGH